MVLCPEGRFALAGSCEASMQRGAWWSGLQLQSRRARDDVVSAAEGGSTCRYGGWRGLERGAVAGAVLQRMVDGLAAHVMRVWGKMDATLESQVDQQDAKCSPPALPSAVAACWRQWRLPRLGPWRRCRVQRTLKRKTHYAGHWTRPAEVSLALQMVKASLGTSNEGVIKYLVLASSANGYLAL